MAPRGILHAVDRNPGRWAETGDPPGASLESGVARALAFLSEPALVGVRIVGFEHPRLSWVDGGVGEGRGRWALACWLTDGQRPANCGQVHRTDVGDEADPEAASGSRPMSPRHRRDRGSGVVVLEDLGRRCARPGPGREPRTGKDRPHDPIHRPEIPTPRQRRGPARRGSAASGTRRRRRSSF